MMLSNKRQLAADFINLPLIDSNNINTYHQTDHKYAHYDFHIDPYLISFLIILQVPIAKMAIKYSSANITVAPFTNSLLIPTTTFAN